MKRFLSRNSKMLFPSKLIIYKYFLRPIWSYAGHIYGCAKPSVVARIQRFQSKVLRIIVDSPFYISNETLHKDLHIPYVNDIYLRHYRKFRQKLTVHSNPFITQLDSPHLPFNPIRRLKRKWSRDLR